jgi:hypothetical protein
MGQLLAGDARLPGFEGKWDVASLKDIVDFGNGKPLEAT